MGVRNSLSNCLFEYEDSDNTKLKIEPYGSAFYHLHLIYMTLVYHQLSRMLNDKDFETERDIALGGFSQKENSLYTQEDEKISAFKAICCSRE